MKIKKGQKYIALIGCQHFENVEKELNPLWNYDNNFFVLPGEIIEINYVYEKNGKVFVVFIGEYENEYGIKYLKTINIETFNSCFEEFK